MVVFIFSFGIEGVSYLRADLPRGCLAVIKLVCDIIVVALRCCLS